MNLHLYKVLNLEDYENCDDLEKTQVMTEKDLLKEFMWAYNNGKIPQELIDDYGGDPDYCDELDNNPELKDLKIGTIIDMMNDICNYECGTGYYILETDVDVEPSIQDKELAKKLSGWLDVLNYWDSDVGECAERINKMGMYREYEVAQDEIYNLWKKLTEAK